MPRLRRMKLAVWLCAAAAAQPNAARAQATADDPASRLPRLVEQSGHANRVLSVAFAPDETILATGSEDRQVRLWDLRSSNEFRTLSGHERAVSALAFDAGGERIASGDGSGGIRLWRVASGAMLGSLQGTRAEIEALAFSPDGTKLATGQLRELAIWDVERGEKIGGWPLRSSDVAFSPDGRLAANRRRRSTQCIGNRPHRTTGNNAAGYLFAFRQRQRTL